MEQHNALLVWGRHGGGAGQLRREGAGAGEAWGGGWGGVVQVTWQTHSEIKFSCLRNEFLNVIRMIYVFNRVVVFSTRLTCMS